MFGSWTHKEKCVIIKLISRCVLGTEVCCGADRVVCWLSHTHDVGTQHLRHRPSISSVSTNHPFLSLSSCSPAYWARLSHQKHFRYHLAHISSHTDWVNTQGIPSIFFYSSSVHFFWCSALLWHIELTVSGKHWSFSCSSSSSRAGSLQDKTAQFCNWQQYSFLCDDVRSLH